MQKKLTRRKRLIDIDKVTLLRLGVPPLLVNRLPPRILAVLIFLSILGFIFFVSVEYKSPILNGLQAILMCVLLVVFLYSIFDPFWAILHPGKRRGRKPPLFKDLSIDVARWNEKRNQQASFKGYDLDLLPILSSFDWDAEKFVTDQLFQWGIDRPATTATRWSSELMRTPPLHLWIGDRRLVYSWMLREMCLGNLKQSPDRPGRWLYKLPSEFQQVYGATECHWEPD